MKKETTNNMKVLFLGNAYPVLNEELCNRGFECIVNTEITEDELIKSINIYSGLIIRSKFHIDSKMIDEADNLKFIARLGAGMEHVDVEYAENKGIKCFNSPEGNRDAVGEHSLGMLLCLFNKICVANTQVRNGKWLREENSGMEIMGKTIGIIGYGNMGSTFAKKLSGFSAEVIAYDKYKFNYSDNYVKECSLEEVMQGSDIISLHVPLTAETHYMINESFLNNLTKKIYLINTSRGPVVKTVDLVKCLKSGKVAGAALDVLEYEKYSFENICSKPDYAFKYLCEAENVILSPHIAGLTKESYYKHAKVIAEKIINAFDNN